MRTVFVDTNVLVYRWDTRDATKQQQADHWIKELWEHEAGRISLQVAHEFYNTVTRKLSPGLPAEVAQEEISDLLTWDHCGSSEALLQRGWDIESKHSLSFWDALIVASAEELNCDVLLTEDLGDGQTLGSVHIVNPFKHSPTFSSAR